MIEAFSIYLISSVVNWLVYICIVPFLVLELLLRYVPFFVLIFLVSNVALLKDNIPVSTNLHDDILLIYVSIIYISTIYGAYRGFINWLLWMNRRRAPKITFKIVEPIVGIAYDAGNLFFNILVAGFASFVVVAFFPISVPILITCFKDID